MSITHLEVVPILELRQSTRNPPNYPEEIGYSPVMSITYLELLLILPINFHPDLSTLNFFQDFWFPRFSFLPSTPQSVWIRSKLKKDYLRHVFIVLARLEYRTHQSTGNHPPSPPKRADPVISFTYLGLVLILPIKFHPDLSTLSVFQDFQFFPSIPPNITGSSRNSK